MLGAVTHFMTCASADETCSLLYSLMSSIRTILSPMISLSTNETIGAFFRLISSFTISSISSGIFYTKWTSKKFISLQLIIGVFSVSSIIEFHKSKAFTITAIAKLDVDELSISVKSIFKIFSVNTRREISNEKFWRSKTMTHKIGKIGVGK